MDILVIIRIIEAVGFIFVGVALMLYAVKKILEYKDGKGKDREEV